MKGESSPTAIRSDRSHPYGPGGLTITRSGMLSVALVGDCSGKQPPEKK